MLITHKHYNHPSTAMLKTIPAARQLATRARSNRKSAVHAGKIATTTSALVRSRRERGGLSATVPHRWHHALAPDPRLGSEGSAFRHIDEAKGLDGLPLVAANRVMIKARRLAETGDLMKARAATQAAEDILVFNSLYSMDPLCEAEESLQRAVCRHEGGAFDAAKSELLRAIRCFDYAINEPDAVTSMFVARLHDQAAKLEDKIGLDRRNVARGLADLYLRTKALRERSIEAFATDFDQRYDGEAYKAELIEAKLHLAFAEADRWIRRRHRTAIAELRTVDRHLARAEAEAGGAIGARINSQRLAIKRLAERGEGSQAKFGHFRRALRTLMMT